MHAALDTECVAFLGERRIADGPLREVVAYIKERLSPQEVANLLVFDLTDSRVIDLDLRGTAEEALQRLAPAKREEAEAQPPAKKRGRPRLGVVAREVTLLPRHWEWLASQPGGASVALRKLVEAARRGNDHSNQVRAARESAYRFMSAMAGDLPGFEEATRALFAGDAQLFVKQIARWPKDIRAHARELARPAFNNPRSARSREASSCNLR